MPTVGAIAGLLESWWPSRLAATWDNVGLLLGDRNRSIHCLLTCLTITRSVVEEAIEFGAGMIVTHHPVFFSPTKRITGDTIQGQNLLRLLAKDIAVYSPHTAHDSACGGVNDQIAALLDLDVVKPLRPNEGPGKYKLVVFVPEESLESVSQAVFQAGGGRIGNYTECSFRQPGTGTFLPGHGSQPSIGALGKKEAVQEVRVEYLCERNCLDKAIQAMRASHPYEEPAYDLYPLAPSLASEGEGRIGRLRNPSSAIDLARLCQQVFGARQVQLIGPIERMIQTVAIGCGAAGGWALDAKNKGADLFITGEMRYHEELEAYQAGISVILLGHHASERFAMVRMAQRLGAEWGGMKILAARNDDLERHFFLA